jgi:hypothetical protein
MFWGLLFVMCVGCVCGVRFIGCPTFVRLMVVLV